MLKLKDVYALPGKPIPLTDYILSDTWIPEVPDLAYSMEYAALAAMDEEGILTVRELVFQYNDGDRTAGMYTLWFNGAPVAIVQEAGRGGRDHNKRWITDANLFFMLCQYLRTKLSDGTLEADVHDPETLVYPEEIFNFYGQKFGDQFGYPAEAVTKGFLLLFKNVIPDVDQALLLVTAEAKFEPMPEYIRRDEHVMKLVRKVNEEELARNPRVAAGCADDGHTQIYWYSQVTRPENCPILSV